MLNLSTNAPAYTSTTSEILDYLRVVDLPATLGVVIPSDLSIKKALTVLSSSALHHIDSLLMILGMSPHQTGLLGSIM